MRLEVFEGGKTALIRQTHAFTGKLGKLCIYKYRIIDIYSVFAVIQFNFHCAER